MFDIFIKKKEIVLECFTYLDYVQQYTPIDYGHNFFPDWWKKNPNEVLEKDLNGVVNSQATIKSCEAFKSFYKSGLVIPSWFELELMVLQHDQIKDHSWRYVSSSPDVSFHYSHSKSHYENFALRDGNNIKFDTPWLLRTKQNVSWVWSQPTWSLREHLSTFTILPGVINFKYQHGANINLFVTNEEKIKSTIIKPNTPLVALHPMSDYIIKLKTILVDEKEFSSLDGLNNLFFRRNAKDFSKLYSNKKQFIDNLEKKKSKCPFSFK